MSLIGRMVRQVNIKSDGDVFHQLFRDSPHHIPTMCPTHIKGVDLHEGDWGKVGSVILWKYSHDGKEKVAKEIIEEIDEKKKLVKFKVIDGDLLQLYKSFVATVQVDTVEHDNLVTWIFEYEKLNEDIEDPVSLMDFATELTKHIETHHLK